MNQERTQRLLIRAVVIGGATALAAAWASTRPPLDAGSLRTALVMLAVTVTAESIAIRLPHAAGGEQITLGEVAIAADVALLSPALAATVAVVGAVTSTLIRRRSAVKAAYNAGQWSLATLAAAACFQGIGGGEIGTSLGLVALFGGMAAFAGSNLLTISAILSTVSGKSLRRVLREEFALSLAIALGNSSVGIVGVVLWLERPLLVPAILAPALTLHVAYRGWIRQREFVGLIEDQKAKLERIVDHSSEGIALADDAGIVALWSPSMERITGVPAAEAEGKAIGFLLRGRGRDGASVQVEVGGPDVSVEVTRADGTDRWLRVRHGPARDEEGTLLWDVIVVHDVTTEHDTEKMKEHFLATVSHELRTPLTPIIGYAKFLIRRDDVDPEIRREALASLLERSEHMQRLVEDLLLASSIDGSGAIRIHARREPVDLAEIVARGVASARISHPKRELVLDGDGPLLVHGDAIRIGQVLANLIENAVKFSPDGAPVVVHVARDGDRAVLAVTDRGRGIPTDKQQEIFDKFRRLENPDRMETGGAGLGLFIVDQLVRAMGGAVSVDSRPGRGSTFTVRLEALAGMPGEVAAEAERSA